jgi:hypothetical protein
VSSIATGGLEVDQGPKLGPQGEPESLIVSYSRKRAAIRALATRSPAVVLTLSAVPFVNVMGTRASMCLTPGIFERVRNTN